MHSDLSNLCQTPVKKPKRRNNDESGDENDDDSDGENVVDDDDEADDDESPDIDMHWNLASYLPEAGACRKNLQTVIIGEFTDEL